MYRIRFHLAKGKNFMKWQVKSPSGEVQFYEPSEVTIFMEGCVLRNQKGTAEKIFGGEDKTVCAWVDAVDLRVVAAPIKNIMSTSAVLHYNPRVLPYWNLDGKDIDKSKHTSLFTSNRHIIKNVK